MEFIYTCPECGADLVDEYIATNPPISAKRCWQCGYYWEAPIEEVMRVEFDPETWRIKNGYGLSVLNNEPQN